MIIFIFTVFATTYKANLVISTISFDNEKSGVFYPEITVDTDGTWREATIRDIWVGQEYKLFMTLNEKKDTINNNFRIVVNNVDDIPGKFQSQTKPKNAKNYYYFGIYYNKPRFFNKGIGKLIKPKRVNSVIKNDFKKINETNANTKELLGKIVKLDWINIKKDFPKLASQNIHSYIAGDINGDNIKDYILIIGENTFGSQNSGPAAVIAYFTNKGKIERLPVDFWEKTSDETSFPELLFTKDFNGDKAEELFISDSDIDTKIPIVYSWFEERNGLMMLYHGTREFWQ